MGALRDSGSQTPIPEDLIASHEPDFNLGWCSRCKAHTTATLRYSKTTTSSGRRSKINVCNHCKRGLCWYRPCDMHRFNKWCVGCSLAIGLITIVCFLSNKLFGFEYSTETGVASSAVLFVVLLVQGVCFPFHYKWRKWVRSQSATENIVISTKRKLAAVTASFITFLLVAFSCWFIVSGTTDILDHRLNLEITVALTLFSISTISLLSAFLVLRKIAGKGYGRSVIRFTGRFFRAISVWAISFVVCGCLIDFGPSSWSPKWIFLVTFNVPVLITLIRSYQLTEKQWDWCLLTFLILHANVVITLLFSESWLPEIHFVRGLIYGQAFVLVALGFCFLYRSVKKQMSIPLFVHYALGTFTNTIIFYFVLNQWH
jgi:hypothetical protein